MSLEREGYAHNRISHEHQLDPKVSSLVKKNIEQSREQGLIHPGILPVINRITSLNPREHSDGAVVGFVVEGGGLGGGTTGWQLAALEYLGLIYNVSAIDSLDYIGAASAAAFNALWAVAGRILEGKSTYYTHLATKDFINPPFTTKKPFVNRDYRPHKPFIINGFFRSVIEKRSDLEWDTIRNASAFLEFSATRLAHNISNDNRIVRLNNFTDLDDAINAAFVSAHVPTFNGIRPARYRGMNLWDGGIAEGIPLSGALEYGCTHIVALSSYADGTEEDRHVWYKNLFANIAMGLWNREVAQIYKDKPERDTRQRQDIRARQNSQAANPYMVLVAGNKTVSFLETKPEEMIMGGRSAAHAMFTALGLRNRQLQEVLVDQMELYRYAA